MIKISRKLIPVMAGILSITMVSAACARSNKGEGTDETSSSESETTEAAADESIARSYPVNGVLVDPKTFDVTLELDNGSVQVAGVLPDMEFAGFLEGEAGVEWNYPGEMEVKLVNEKNYVSMNLHGIAEQDASFGLPVASGDGYYIPLGDGKLIPSSDKDWIEYLDGQVFPVIEQLSMPFFAVQKGDMAILYIVENPYRTDMKFQDDGGLKVELINYFDNIDEPKENKIRIYVTKNDPVAISKIYKDYIAESGRFVTLEQKAKGNPDIEKLYGAPFIYLWGDRILAPEDIKWEMFRKELGNGTFSYVMERIGLQEESGEIVEVFKALSGQDYVDQYQKEVVCNGLSSVLGSDSFYDEERLPKKNDRINVLLEKGKDNLNQKEIIELNKQALYANAETVFSNPDDWYRQGTVDLIKDMKDSGLDRAWIGLNDWKQAFNKPQLVEEAVKEGYLIGPYDSYHSIHEPGKVQWSTAGFEDKSLYDSAVVTDKEGNIIAGFNKVGRKLNPTLSLPSVKGRVEQILSTGIGFNSWFIDCDVTGEIYDDYTKEHITTKQQDMAARLERMEYIRDDKNMVIGSEGGNDIGAATIAYAHGIELQTFSWMDDDMSKNKDSEYYLGRFYSASGGVPEKFAKPVPVKEKYRKLFLDMSYQVPLYKLVYNDSVITSYHWDWSTYKIQNEAENRMMREVLYNVPPIYHLDAKEWQTYKDSIAAHNKVWSQFSRQAIEHEMTDFAVLSEDRLVQKTSYGDKLTAVANFSDSEFQYEDTTIPAKSVLIIENGNKQVYTPS